MDQINFELTFAGKHCDVSEALQEFTRNKLVKLGRHSDSIMKVDMIFEVDKLRQIVKAVVSLKGRSVAATASTENMYKSIDELLDKLVRQLEGLKK
jgi:putative sigma-54 modulation protein